MRNANLGRIEGLPAKFGKAFGLELYRRGNFCRNFEQGVKNAYDQKRIPVPIYLSIGSEFNSAALSMVLPHYQIFAQHRCHSLYLNFGGQPEPLRDELLGLPTGLCKGMAGSNAFSCPSIHMFGHSGLMGEQIPIAVGAAYASRKPTLAICGDASVEEDYIYPSLGWAASEKLPIVFICEDNDLSILTKVDVRRKWNPAEMAKALGMFAIDIADDPWTIAHHAKHIAQSGKPGFINIRTVRVLWHAGTGIDGDPEWDRYALVESELHKLGISQGELDEMDRQHKGMVEKIWNAQ